MKAHHPPAPRFLLTPNYSAEDIQKAVRLNDELRRLNALADQYSPRRMEAERKSALAKVHGDPTENAFKALATATMPVAARPGVEPGLAAAHRHKELRSAARRVAWRFYGEQVQPFLREVFQREIEHLAAEAREQRNREAEWAEQFKPLKAWGAYYGVPFTPPSATFILDQWAGDLRKAMGDALALRGDASGSTEPPLLHAVLSKVQLTLPVVPSSAPPVKTPLIGRARIELGAVAD